MKLAKEIVARALEKEEMMITFPNLNIDVTEIVKMECYRTLKSIKAVIDDDSLNDADCFIRIEKIICELEEMGSDGKNRHDFA